MWVHACSCFHKWRLDLPKAKSATRGCEPRARVNETWMRDVVGCGTPAKGKALEAWGMNPRPSRLLSQCRVSTPLALWVVVVDVLC